MKQKPSERPFVESFAERAGLNKVKRSKHPRLCYLCGAITNDPHAKLKFDLAELYLKSRGDMVINPLKLNPLGTKWEDAMSYDLAIINSMKDAYLPLLKIARFLNEDMTFFPTLVDIDPPDRQFDSPGKRLEKAIAFDVIPTVQLSIEWDNLLKQAINETETKGNTTNEK